MNGAVWVHHTFNISKKSHKQNGRYLRKANLWREIMFAVAFSMRYYYSKDSSIFFPFKKENADTLFKKLTNQYPITGEFIYIPTISHRQKLVAYKKN